MEIDEEAAAIATMLQEDFVASLKEVQRKAALAFKGAAAPVCIDVRIGGHELPQLADPSTGAAHDAGYYSNNGNWSDALPPSLAAERIVDASLIRFSQRSMARRFQDGRSLEGLILGLMRGTFNPMKDDFLKLTCVEKADTKGSPALYSKDNRRLYCLQEYQRRICGEPVPVRVRILAWQDVVDACKFQRNYDTELDGTDIVIR